MRKFVLIALCVVMLTFSCSAEYVSDTDVLIDISDQLNSYIDYTSQTLMYKPFNEYNVIESLLLLIFCVLVIVYFIKFINYIWL